MSAEDGMREVSQTEFFAKVGPLDVIPEPQRMGGTWGRSLWKLRRGGLVGVSVTQAGYPLRRRYYVPKESGE